MAPVTPHNVPALKDPSLLKKNVAYVNGKWIGAASGKTYEVKDPATGKVISTCPEFDDKDTNEAIKAASAAFVTFRRKSARERSKYIRKWYELMVENKDDLATLITWENGKPSKDAQGEVAYAASFFEWFAEEAPRTYGDVIPPTDPDTRITVLKQPVGVCGLLTPWNFPAAMLTRKIGPALAAGCTVVCKSPAETPLTSLALAELADRAGIPPGVVNVISAMSNTPLVGETLTTSPAVHKISFTGSTPVGKLLMKQSSSTLKKLSFELGGNAPFIVFPDADLDVAIEGAAACKFRNSGQTCVCSNRIYVHADIYDDFATRLVEKVKKFKIGHGFESDTTHGPLIHAKAIDKVEAHVKDAQKHGARLLTGGHRLTDLGPTFYAPTVLADAHCDMAIASEETFGPVAALFKFTSEAEVVAAANATPVGLAAYFYSKDIARCARVSEALEAGMVGVNTPLVSDVAAPFGGVKESGFGREGSRYGVEEYCVVKMITMGGMNGELEGSEKKD